MYARKNKENVRNIKKIAYVYNIAISLFLTCDFTSIKLNKQHFLCNSDLCLFLNCNYCVINFAYYIFELFLLIYFIMSMSISVQAFFKNIIKIITRSPLFVSHEL